MTASSCPATRPASAAIDLPPKQQVAVSAPGSRRGSFCQPNRSHQLLSPLLTPTLSAPADVLLPRAFAATIGTEPTGRGNLGRPLCSVHTYAPETKLSQTLELPLKRRAPQAVFGTAPRSPLRRKDNALPSIPPVSREATDFRQPHSFHATFASAKPLRPPSSRCRVHSYQRGDLRSSGFHATFGSDSRF